MLDLSGIEQELAWEREMLDMGVSRFRAQEYRAAEKGAFERTNAGRRLLRDYLTFSSEFIAHWLAGNQPGNRKRNKYAKLLDTVATDKLAMFSLYAVIQGMFAETPLATVYRKLGTMVEDELRFSKFELNDAEYFRVIQEDLDRRKSKNYRHRHAVMVHTMNKRGVTWKSWPPEVLIGVGSTLLSLVMESTDLISLKTIQASQRKKKTLLVPSPELIEWVQKSNEATEMNLPDRMPCIIEPERWTGPFTGGYWSSQLGMTTPLVKTRRGAAGKAHKRMVHASRMPSVYKAVNAMQGTQWEINTQVLDVMQQVWTKNLGIGMPSTQPIDIPPSPLDKDQKPGELSDAVKAAFDNWKAEARELYAMEADRTAKVLGVARTLRIAQLLRNKPKLHFVYQMDFRGRVYCTTSGVSPQGADHAKAVLRFKRGKELGERGLYWLAVHGANKYGYDKASYDDRVLWAQDNIERIREAARDPIAARSFWGEADKPYQFLAWCFEYAQAFDVGPAFVSHLPVALDGSCNGLQHFSAMLRDSRGGAAVNLVPSDKPSDIYQDVADVATRKLRGIARDPAAENCVEAQNWLALFDELETGGMSRKLSKKPVMTLPYGSTMNACTSSVYAWYKENGDGFFPKDETFGHAVFLSRVLWSSIGEVVVAARVAMGWIQECASILAKEQHPLMYTTPLGFPVYQGSRQIEELLISSQVGGNQFRVKIAKDKKELCVRKQRQGSSPNLVHSVDATHMMMCVLSGSQEGIEDYAMIHDDFGVHACHADTWQRIIREEFVALHESFDVLTEFKRVHEERTGITLPDLPEKGMLDLDGVWSSEYFFG